MLILERMRPEQLQLVLPAATQPIRESSQRTHENANRQQELEPIDHG